MNWVALEILLGSPLRDLAPLLDRIDAAAHERFARSKDFFDAVALAEAQLLRAFGSGTLVGEPSHVAKEVERVSTMYEQAIRMTQATTRQVDSATTQIATLSRLLRSLAPEGNDDAVQAAAALKLIHARIAGQSDDVPVAGREAATSVARSRRAPPPPSRAQ